MFLCTLPVTCCHVQSDMNKRSSFLDFVHNDMSSERMFSSVCMMYELSKHELIL